MKITDGVVYMVRGDTESLTVSIKDSSGQAYTLQTGDTLTLTLRSNTGDEAPVMSVTSSTGTIPISHSDTSKLAVGQYSADIELKKANGDIHTIWPTWDVTNDTRKIKGNTNWKNWWLTPEVTQ